MKKFLAILVALVLCLSLCAGALAEDFPTKEITYLCGYGAGGSSDLQARLMQPYAEKYLGAPMVVENLGGAGGFLVTRGECGVEARQVRARDLRDEEL